MIEKSIYQSKIQSIYNICICKGFFLFIPDFTTVKELDLQSLPEIIETTAKNGVVAVVTSNVKLFLKTIR